MAMDVLRSGYSRPCRFRADSDDTFTIRWYKCLPGAKVYPGSHAFGSSVWDGDHANYRGAGEIASAEQLWYKGRNPGFPGLQPCGLPAWYRRGVPASALVAAPPADCNCHLFIATGGVIIGGTGYPLPFGGVLIGGTGYP